MSNIVPARSGPRGIVQKCSRCGNLAPLFSKGVFTQWPAGLCLKCMILMVNQIMGTLKAFTDPLARFLVGHGKVEPGKPLPKGADLAKVLGEIAPVPERKEL